MEVNLWNGSKSLDDGATDRAGAKRDGPPETPAVRRPSRVWLALWLIVVAAGAVLQIMGFFWMRRGGALGVVGIVLGYVGFVGAARTVGRSPLWALWGLLPLVGPLAAGGLALERPLSEPHDKTSPSEWGMLGVLTVVLHIMIVGGITNMLSLHGPRVRQSEARSNLQAIYVAQTAFHADHRRYGRTFEEIGIQLDGNSNRGACRSCRYTYRLDVSGKPGTVISGGMGPVTPDNTVVPAGISPTGFTATATANLDNDATIDQWHVNDSRGGLIEGKADVSDEDRSINLFVDWTLHTRRFWEEFGEAIFFNPTFRRINDASVWGGSTRHSRSH